MVMGLVLLGWDIAALWPHSFYINTSSPQRQLEPVHSISITPPILHLDRRYVKALG